MDSTGIHWILVESSGIQWIPWILRTTKNQLQKMPSSSAIKKPFPPSFPSTPTSPPAAPTKCPLTLPPPRPEAEGQVPPFSQEKKVVESSSSDDEPSPTTSSSSDRRGDQRRKDGGRGGGGGRGVMKRGKVTMGALSATENLRAQGGRGGGGGAGGGGREIDEEGPGVRFLSAVGETVRPRQ